MAESISLAQVATDLQNYAYDHKEHIAKSLMKIGFEGLSGSPVKPLVEYVNILPAEGEIVLTDLITGDPLQPGNKGTFDPKLYGTFKTRKAKPEPIKVDLLFGEQKIRNMYNTYIGRVKYASVDPREVPYEEWILDELNKDVRKYLRLALFNAALAPNGTTSADIFDGWVEQISDTITNAPTTINVVNMAAWTIDNAVTEAEKMAEALPSSMAYGEESVLVLSKARYDLYNKAFRKAYGGLNYNNEFKKTYLEGTQIELIVEDGVAAFNRPFITVRQNLAFLMDDARMGNVRFDFSERDRSMAYLMDFEGGVGISATELLYVGAFV